MQEVLGKTIQQWWDDTPYGAFEHAVRAGIDSEYGLNNAAAAPYEAEEME